MYKHETILETFLSFESIIEALFNTLLWIVRLTKRLENKSKKNIHLSIIGIARQMSWLNELGWNKEVMSPR
jgi:hypothetical protein